MEGAEKSESAGAAEIKNAERGWRKAERQPRGLGRLGCIQTAEPALAGASTHWAIRCRAREGCADCSALQKNYSPHLQRSNMREMRAGAMAFAQKRIVCPNSTGVGGSIGRSGMTAALALGFRRLAILELRGRFSKNQGFEPFFVFYCDTEWGATPWTLPHKNLFFAMWNVFAMPDAGCRIRILVELLGLAWLGIPASISKLRHDQFSRIPRQMRHFLKPFLNWKFAPKKGVKNPQVRRK